MKKVPKDAWGREFIYESPGRNGDFDLFSYGADGQEGGEDSNSDITNWE
jgi:general secretion pathway protein G